MTLYGSHKLKVIQNLPRELAEIVEEVYRFGFFYANMDEFIPDIPDREEQMYMILMIAKKAQLTVSFNLEKNVCIFE